MTSPPLVLCEDIFSKSSQPSSTRSSSISLSITSTSSSSSSSSSICESLECLTTKSNTQPISLINTNILGLLDVHSLLEYQHVTPTTSNPTPTSNTLSNSNNSNKSILRGGHVDALIVLATSANASVHAATHPIKTLTSHPSSSKTSSLSSRSFDAVQLDEFSSNKVNFLYQEAFLTTYRTILEPFDLINKLILRYRLFSTNTSNNKATSSTNQKSNERNETDLNVSLNESGRDEKFDFNRFRLLNKQTKMSASAARNSLTLLIRVVDDLEG